MTMPRPPSFPFPAMFCIADHRKFFRNWARSRPFLCGVAAILLLAGSNSASAAPFAWNLPNVMAAADSFAAFVTEASQRFGIPASWIRAVIQAESMGDAKALSSKGAMGLMQIMPETWADLRLRYGLGANPYDPHDNILAGAAYLGELHDRYGTLGFLAAYNAGPARYEEHLVTGEPLPEETQNYLAFLAPLIGERAANGAMITASVIRSWTDASLFTRQTYDRTSVDRTALTPQSGGLFIAISDQDSQP